MKILVLILALSLLQACTNKEKLIEKCADYNDVSWLENEIAKLQDEQMVLEDKNIMIVPLEVIEKTAEFYFFSKKLEDGTIISSDGVIYKPDGTIISPLDQINEKIHLKQKELDYFKSLSLSEKLFETYYENSFQYCEEEFKKNTVTFKAKWR